MDKHITNISSYRLSFFEKLTLCRGLKFAIPEQVSPTEVIASFERAYWFLEPNLQQDQKELTTATLRSVGVSYIHSRCPTPPKALVKAIHRLNRRNDIVISKPDKGSGVVIMNKEDYLRLLAEASANNQSKFRPCSTEKPKSRGRPPSLTARKREGTEHCR